VKRVTLFTDMVGEMTAPIAIGGLIDWPSQ